METEAAILIPTFARTKLLAEAVWCAMRTGSPVLVVNDCPEQELEIEGDDVFVVNQPEACPTFGAKRNLCLDYAKLFMNVGHVAWLDDDDLCLPHYTERLLSARVNAKAVWSTATWYVNGEWWNIQSHAMEILLPLASGLRYPEVEQHEESAMMQQLRAYGLVECGSTPPAYIYRQSIPGLIRISDNFTTGGSLTVRQKAQARIAAGLEPGGRVVVVPHRPEIPGAPAVVQAAFS